MTYSHRQYPAQGCFHHALRAHACLSRLACLICLVASLAPACSIAQSQQAAPYSRPHRQRANAKNAPTETAQAVPPPDSVKPQRPNWPAQSPPAPPSVTFDSKGLQIVAENSTLSSILDQVSTETGAKVEGLSGDERVFGSYGPGQPRDVLADLLSGVNYNVLILGDQAQGQPLRVVLSPRKAGVPNAQPNSVPQQDQEDEYQPPEPQEAPQILQPQQPPMNEPPMNRPITPQERMQMMQERQRQIEQQQQQQQPQD